MKTNLPFLCAVVGVVSGFMLAACVPEDTSPPPIFNAIDPSQSCPADQVGWDFTTGGNESDVLVQPVGSEIKIQRIEYTCFKGTTATTTDLTPQYRAECDNSKFCERPILRDAEAAATAFPGSCDRKALTARYRCGNEPTEYNIDRITWSEGSYDYYRRIVNQPNNEPADKITFACGEPITFKGLSFQISTGMSTIRDNTKAYLNCNGLRRCVSNDRSNTVDYSGTASNLTKYYYTCGKSPVVREYVMDNTQGTPKSYIDFHCGDAVQQAGAERAPVIYFKGLTYSKDSSTEDLPAETVQAFERQLKQSCEGKRSCTVPVTTAQVPQSGDGTFRLEYWCGASKGFTERKYFHTRQLVGGSQFKGTGEFALQCGSRIKVVYGNKPWVANECPEGSRVCSLPHGEGDTAVNFFCEANGDTASNSIVLYDTKGSDLRYLERSVECPLETDTTGIRITGLRYDGNNIAEKPRISTLSACNGKQSCLVRAHVDPLSGQQPRYQFRYTCPNASETVGIRQVVNGVHMEYLDCKPNVDVTSMSVCQAQVVYGSRTPMCATKSPSCNVNFLLSSNPEYTRDCVDGGIRIVYKCGGDQNYQTALFSGDRLPRSADGGNYAEDGGSLISGVVTCPYDPTPKASASTKKCIPATCASNKRRNNEMDCVDDAQIAVYTTFNAAPGFATPQAVAAPVMKQGFPYIKAILVNGVTGGGAFARSQAGTVWAYDVFKKKDGTGPEVYGFRCTVGSFGYNFTAPNGVSVFGEWVGQYSTLADACYKQAPYGDTTSSWYDASRRANAVNEQVFRDSYNYVRTYAVAALDAKGRVVKASKNAPNPIGFFYTPATGYVDKFAFYAQQSDFVFKQPVTFLPSRQIELSAVSGSLGVSQILFDKETQYSPPSLDMDFGWSLLGDSPFHPMSDKRIIQTNVGQLRSRAPRAVVEIAKVDSSLTNIWVADNMATVATYPLAGGNPQEAKERFEARLSRDIVKRIMTVKGSGGLKRADGFMANNIEVNTVFKARVCIDINGLAHAPGDTDLDNKFDSATVGGETYKLGITRRCSAEYPFTVTRDLFPKPVLPINAAENPIGVGNTTGQGGDRVSSRNNIGNQSQCRRSCTVNADCGTGVTCEKPPGVIGVCAEVNDVSQCRTTFRKDMVTGGGSGFGRSILGINNTSDTDAPNGVRAATAQTASSRNGVTLMGYNVLDAEETKEGQVILPSTKRTTSFSLGRIWASAQQIGEAMKKLQTQGNPSPVKPWWKPSFSAGPKGKNPLPGIAFGIGADGYVFAGPVVLYLEISFGASVSFDITLKFIKDKQTASNKNAEAQYPCLNLTGTKCIQLSSELKNFTEANQDCNLKGGRLVEPRTASALAELRAAVGSEDVWIGAQASHIFDDPSCSDLSPTTSAQATARLAECKANSATRYLWIRGSTAFADTRPDGTAYNQAQYSTAQGFGTISSIANNGSPLPSGVLLKANGNLENHATSNKLSPNSAVTTPQAVRAAKYVCEFDAARAYTASEVSFGPSLEASVGVGASACWPSGVIGACISAEFKFITVGISVETGQKSIKIYDTETTLGAPRATIGGKGASAKWEWAALTGRIYAEIRYLFGSDDWTIVSYSGVAREEKELWNDVERFRR